VAYSYAGGAAVAKRETAMPVPLQTTPLPPATPQKGRVSQASQEVCYLDLALGPDANNASFAW
jgi:hypothetical protein